METVWSSLVNRRSSWKILQLTAQLHNVYFLLQSKTTLVDSEMINITKFDIVTLCATLSEENNVFENNIYLHFVYTIEVFLKQLVTGHPVLIKISTELTTQLQYLNHKTEQMNALTWTCQISRRCQTMLVADENTPSSRFQNPFLPMFPQLFKYETILLKWVECCC